MVQWTRSRRFLHFCVLGGAPLTSIVRRQANLHMKHVFIILTFCMLLTACGRDAKLTKEIPSAWKQERTNSQNGHTFVSTTTISPDGTFSYVRLWNERPLTNTFAGTWKIKGGVMFLTLTNRSGPNPNIPPGVAPLQRKIIHLDAHQLIEESDGVTIKSSR